MKPFSSLVPKLYLGTSLSPQLSCFIRKDEAQLRRQAHSPVQLGNEERHFPVAAVYDRRPYPMINFIGGHRPPLQGKAPLPGGQRLPRRFL